MGQELESIIYIDRKERKMHNRSKIVRELQAAQMQGEVRETKTIILSDKVEVLGILEFSQEAVLSEAEFAAIDGGFCMDISLPALLSLSVQKFKKRRV